MRSLAEEVKTHLEEERDGFPTHCLSGRYQQNTRFAQSQWKSLPLSALRSCAGLGPVPSPATHPGQTWHLLLAPSQVRRQSGTDTAGRVVAIEIERHSRVTPVSSELISKKRTCFYLTEQIRNCHFSPHTNSYWSDSRAETTSCSRQSQQAPRCKQTYPKKVHPSPLRHSHHLLAASYWTRGFFWSAGMTDGETSSRISPETGDLPRPAGHWDAVCTWKRETVATWSLSTGW